eukprot:219542_1
MATARFNAFVFKALSNSSMYGYSATHIMSSRQFGRTPKKKEETKSKKDIKHEEKMKKLLSQYPDPSQPKRPAPTYIRFCAEYRKHNQTVTFSRETIASLSKEISKAWRTLPDRKKAVYSEQYAKERQQYKIAKQKYNDSNRRQLWLEKIVILAQEKPP